MKKRLAAKAAKRVMNEETKLWLEKELAALPKLEIVNCSRCGRELTDLESIKAKIGPECARQEIADFGNKDYDPEADEGGEPTEVENDNDSETEEAGNG